ncbi:YesN/AraC family two-component response regulator [Hydrogenispora ethanolica]|jgi:two-component system response regulator YesN|uniref:YesN/AraC family two-component response regulator n=1 Tax=Hydrogenispora ethanolica TaxID=1082276 RepID=A0A4R1R7K6_HYDET|nr:helix-turn-helix domain-containing protein [Hydrogenispora ethanolica]TCL61500.1 YesN/AraC family two-component response regulator [Hydrogenispora ethanolica]
MTLKILLADDEPKVLRGMEMVIQRAGEDWEITGRARDGAGALQLIAQDRPDVVITDIKMPVMDGLELIERAKLVAPELQFIILSGYPDFQYAQQALKLGTVDYILKPPAYQDLLNSLKTVAAGKLGREAQKREEAELDALKRAAAQSRRERIFQELVYNPEPRILDDLTPDSREGGLFFAPFILCFIQLDNVTLAGLPAEEFETNLQKLTLFREAVRKAMDARNGCVLDLHNGGYCCLLPATDHDPAALQSQVGALHAELSAQLAESLTIGMSEPHEQPDQFRAAYKECLVIMRNKFFFPKNSLIRFGEMNPMAGPDSYPLELEAEFLEAMHLGDGDRSSLILQQMIQKFRQIADRDSTKFKNLVAEFIVTVSGNLAENGAAALPRETANSEMIGKITASDNIDDLQALLSEYTKSIAAHFCAANKPGCRRIINHIITYIKNHYFNDISLRQIAADFFMNESYLSDLFKRETGVSFTNFLTEFRVEQAKALLRQLDLKTYEIAEMVGYKDVKYFNKVFKKHTGMTPNEYRERMV